MRIMQLQEIINTQAQTFEVGVIYEFVIPDPINYKNIIFFIQKVRESMEINPESIIAELLKYYKKIERDMTISPNDICKKGCCECCTNDFEISITEYFMILKYLGINFGEKYIREISEKARVSINSDSCIFIDCTNGLCNIYEVRPLICRKYSLYNDYCDCKKINAKTDLISGKPDTSKNTLFFQHSLLPDKKIMCPNKRIVHWFSNLKNGELVNDKMKNLFYASFTENTDKFIETLLQP